ncbi:MAG: MBL fold metallo-hydrolase [Magnetococcales bacterium]|nr:MBL fold metallo-hydrolase [Magnetococcales bacterium]
MKVTFWGTRGSIPVSLDFKNVRRKVAGALLKASGRTFENADAVEAFIDSELTFPEYGSFGGNTSCVEIDAASPEFLLCDLGSGVRPFGMSVLARHGMAPQTYHVLMSHLHWDHVMGFPFLVPAYVPGNVIHIYGCHDDLEKTFRRQQRGPNFPVEFNHLAAKIHFHQMVPGEARVICGCRVTPILQIHGNDSYGYRVEKEGKVVVYSTDSEHKLGNPSEIERFSDFFRDADLVIFDSQYSLAETVMMKEDWGHSSNVVGVELCQLAKAKRLALFHHDPLHDDFRIQALLEETRRLEEITRPDAPLEVIAAYDGLTVEL